jgi:hypothetical protein
VSYKEYIKDKRVCFVGPSPILVGKEEGEYIDSFDIVVKTNNAINLSSSVYYKDYGIRCDVLYTNNQFQREMGPLPVKSWGHNDLKWLCMKVCNREYLDYYKSFLNVRMIKESINLVNSKINSATMGAYIFTDIAILEPLEFYITGVDFFTSKKAKFEHDNYQEYIDGYLPDKVRSQGNEINKGKSEDGHNQIENTRYIHSLVEKYNIQMNKESRVLMMKVINGEISQL